MEQSRPIADRWSGDTRSQAYVVWGATVQLNTNRVVHERKQVREYRTECTANRHFMLPLPIPNSTHSQISAEISESKQNRKVALAESLAVQTKRPTLELLNDMQVSSLTCIPPPESLLQSEHCGSHFSIWLSIKMAAPSGRNRNSDLISYESLERFPRWT